MGKSTRKTQTLLPAVFQTPKNTDFLEATLDQLIEPAKVQKLSQFVGRTTEANYKISDGYVPEINEDRTNYQLEPATVYKSNGQTVDFAVPYIDLINEINASGGNYSKHDRMLSNQTYSYAPPIDADKFVNYREYYWIPLGLSPIRLSPGTPGARVGFDVVNNAAGGYQFSHKSLSNPDIIVYKGNTYDFKINAYGHPFWIKSQYGTGTDFAVSSELVTNNGAQEGTVTLKVPASDSSTNHPNVLYYQCQNHIAMKGRIIIRDLADEVFDVNENLIGATAFTDYTGLVASNGQVVTLSTDVVDTHQNKTYYIEGVGTDIDLIPETEIRTYGDWAQELGAIWDEDGVEGWDTTGFDNSTGQLVKTDYFTISRQSSDRNAWSRSNRWFHRSVIEESNKRNNYAIELNEADRAKRPIIEFQSGLNLYNHGTSHRVIDVLDTTTTDALSLVAGTVGFIADTTLLREGDKVVFTADPAENNKIFTVRYLALDSSTARENIDNVNRIHLQLEDDSTVIADGTAVVAKRGNANKGQTYYYTRSTEEWSKAQQKTGVNQAPLFDVFNTSGISIGNLTTYVSTNFTGNSVFAINTDEQGTPDTVYGQNVLYSRLGLLSDIQVKDAYNDSTFTYVSGSATITEDIKQHFMRRTNRLGEHTYITNYAKSGTAVKQRVVQQYTADNNQTDYEVSSFAKPSDLSDLNVQVYVNGVKTTGFNTVSGTDSKLFVRLTTASAQDDIVTIKSHSTTGIRTSQGYYEVAVAAEKNPLNESISLFTVGDIKDHYVSALNNLDTVTGTQIGVNNTRDLPPIFENGTTVLQHEGSFPLASLFARDNDVNLIDAWRQTGSHYEQFKANILRQSEKLISGDIARDNLDAILEVINANKNSAMAYYDSDMLAYGTDKTQLKYTVVDSSVQYYPITTEFNLDSLSTRAIYVYVNDVQLIQGKDYNFVGVEDSSNFTGIEMIASLAKDDVIKIEEYVSTDANFVPPTPAKLGLAPAYEPTLSLDNTYQADDSTTNGVKVLLGHDGSKMIAFNDFRDEIMLEFEKRIYNNIKVKYDQSMLDIAFGRFKTNEYTRTELLNIFARDFYYWSGVNGVDYTTNDVYTGENAFTWNYTDFSKTIKRSTDADPLPGHWRGAYLEYYGTTSPHTKPWEMFDFSIKPSWWDDEYGPAPYTSGNATLWDHVKRGQIVRGSRAGTYEKYARPEIYTAIPVNDNGDLLDPGTAGLLADDTVNSLNKTKNWIYGDMGPAEHAWRFSSSWRYAEQIANFLSHPVKYAGLFFDVSRQTKNIINQTVYDGKFRTSPNNFTLPGSEQTAGYINIIADYLKGTGVDVNNALKIRLDNLSVQLAYKMAGYTNKDNLDVKLGSSSPLSSSQSVFAPKENYDLVVHKSAPSSVVNYSGIIVEKSTNGYKVSGYSNFDRAFTIFPALINNDYAIISVGQTTESFTEWQGGGFYNIGSIVRNEGKYYRATKAISSSQSFVEGNWELIGSALPLQGGTSVRKYKSYSPVAATVPYGTEYRTVQDLANFVYGYEKHLEHKGFMFDEFSKDLNLTMDWDLSAKEILFWTTQNWANGSVLSVSPASSVLKHVKKDSIGDDLIQGDKFYTVLQQDGFPIQPKNLRVRRTDGEFIIETNPAEDGIYNADIRAVQKEHLLVLDNETAFKDVIYNRILGTRQTRLKLVGFKTADWQGDLYAPGFIIDRALVKDWNEYTDYQIGDVVNYQGNTYAATINHASTNVFDPSKFINKPTPTNDILNNLDNKAESFRDFYSLDTENFDAEQQRYAQHLIGYQKRDYLVNLGFEEQTQYKLYQGFIKDKGTNKVVDRFRLPNQQGQTKTFDLFEEWMFRVGEYGGHRTLTQFAYPVSDSTHKELQYVYELTSSTKDDTETVINVADTELNKRPYNLPSTKFATYAYDASNYPASILKLGTAGYPQTEQVDFTVWSTDDLFNLDVSTFEEGTLIWVANTASGSWDVLRVNTLKTPILDYKQFDDKVQFETRDQHGLVAGDILAVMDFSGQAEGVYRLEEPFDSTDTSTKFSITFTDSLDSVATQGTLAKLQSVRINDFDDISTITPPKGWEVNDYVYVDNNYETNDGSWQVYKRDALGNFEVQGSLSLNTDLSDAKADDENFGHDITLSNDGKWMAVGSPNKNRVLIYNRPTLNDPIINYQQLTPDLANSAADDLFGNAVDISTDGTTLLIGCPQTSDIVKMTSVSLDSTRTLARGTDVTGAVTGATGKILRYEEGESQDVFHIKVTAGTDFADSALNAFDSSSVTVVDAITDGDRTNQGTVYVITRNVDQLYATRENIVSPALAQGEKFGHAVAISGNSEWIAIGAPGGPNDSTFANRGSVYVYRQIQDSSSASASYIYQQTLTPGDNEEEKDDSANQGQQFGDVVKISGDGNTIVVGAKLHDDSSVTDAGKVYVYRKLDGTFVKVEEFNPTVARNETRFGEAVGISADGSDLLIGSPREKDTVSEQGVVYHYTNNVSSHVGDGSTTAFVPSFTVDKYTRLYVSAGVNQYKFDDSSTTLSYHVNESTNTVTLSSTPALNEQIVIQQYKFESKIKGSPVEVGARFGSQLDVYNDQLAVYSSSGLTTRKTTFDKFRLDSSSTARNETTFDNKGTTFSSDVQDTGNVQIFKKYSDTFIHNETLSNNSAASNDSFGEALAVSDRYVYVAAPDREILVNNDSSTRENAGEVFIYEKTGTIDYWNVDVTQPNLVNPFLLRKSFLYTRGNNTLVQDMPRIDPVKDLFFTDVEQNIKFKVPFDPADYNSWNDEHVGEVWLDTTQLKFLWYEQGDYNYKLKNWGKVHPSATVSVKEWVKSLLTPTQWNAQSSTSEGQQAGFTGTANDVFVTQQVFDDRTNSFATYYYYWVEESTTVPNVDTRSLTTAQIASAIRNPKSFAENYSAVVGQDAILLSIQPSVLTNKNLAFHIENTTDVDFIEPHVEYQLVAEGDDDVSINTDLVAKMEDSLIGFDKFGRSVPDLTFPDDMRYGLENRPRQTMFKDRIGALKDIVEFTNDRLLDQPYATQVDLSLFNKKDPVPNILLGEYDRAVDTEIDVEYINTETLSEGFKVLVEFDSLAQGWVIYEYDGATFSRVRTQTYDTTRYWSLADYYVTGYSASTVPDIIVADEKGKKELDAPTTGTVVKVRSSYNGKFRLYVKTAQGYDVVGIGDGTIQLSTGIYDLASVNAGFGGDAYDTKVYDEEAVQELRNILQGIQNFNQSSEFNYNELFFTAVKIALEQDSGVDWVIKSSFLKKNNIIESMPVGTEFELDNSENVTKYFNEVLPFATKVRDDVNKYGVLDTNEGDFTDFDNQTYWDTTRREYINPEVFPGDSTYYDVYENYPHKFYSDNYKYSIASIVVDDGGAGYTTAPDVSIAGGGGSGTVAKAVVIDGVVSSIQVTTVGTGYIETPTVVIDGGGGAVTTEAKAHAVLSNSKIRKLNETIKFDRIASNHALAGGPANIKTWTKDTVYSKGDNIRFGNEIYRVQNSFKSGITFDADVLQDDSTVSGDSSTVGSLNPLVLWNAADRIHAYYSPNTGMPGLIGDGSTVINAYAQLMTGLEYKGVRMASPTFSTGEGYDQANYDMTNYDKNVSDPDLTAEDLTDLDTVIDSKTFTTSLGTRAEDINVVGDAFISEYSANGPEELLPGGVYDTLDMKVFTRTTDGASIIQKRNHYGDSSTTTFSIPEPKAVDGVRVFINDQFKLQTTDYTIDYKNKTITFTSAPPLNSFIKIVCFQVSTDNLLANITREGDGLTVAFNINVTHNLIKQTYVLVNGVKTAITLSREVGKQTSTVTFSTAPADDAVIDMYFFDLDTSKKAFSEVETTEYTVATDSSETTLSLTTLPSSFGPFHHKVIVEGVAGTTSTNRYRLKPPQVKYYTGDATTSIFLLPDEPQGSELATVANTEVYLNGVLQSPAEYALETNADLKSQIVFSIAPSNGDAIAIVLKVGMDYTVNEQGQLRLYNNWSDGSSIHNEKIFVTTFNNHDQMGMRTEVFAASTGSLIINELDYGAVALGDSSTNDSSTSPITPGTFIDLGAITSAADTLLDRGQIVNDATVADISEKTYVLDFVPTNSDYVFVALNKNYLTANIDFRVEGNKVIIPRIAPSATDVVTIHYLTENTVSQNAIGYRIFKDILNRYHYRRISETHSTVLTQTLNVDDTEIQVRNTSVLPTPDIANNVPGVIFIGKERIAYFEKDGNTLKRLFRGTLGTGVQTHVGGTRVVDASKIQEIPYEDTTTMNRHTGDGSTVFFGTTFTPSDKNQLVVEVGGETTTAYSLGGDSSQGIQFDTAPASGVFVRIYLKTGSIWYTAGTLDDSSTAANGLGLQQSKTAQAKFLKKETTNIDLILV